MIELMNEHADILQADVQALVNPVNCVGVAGKGLALKFKDAFPGALAMYKQDCAIGNVRLGKMNVQHAQMVQVAPNPLWVINFPTKRHWKDTSKLQDIRDGMIDLIWQANQRMIKSIAVPALGCGCGGLAWDDVLPLLKAMAALLPGVRILAYPPHED
jgi:O-acetyl-ADP-ribose deacetylase (regulator of RNase III)